MNSEARANWKIKLGKAYEQSQAAFKQQVETRIKPPLKASQAKIQQVGTQVKVGTDAVLSASEKWLQEKRMWAYDALEAPQQRLEANMAGAFLAPGVGFVREYMHNRNFRDGTNFLVVLAGVSFLVGPHIHQWQVDVAAQAAVQAEAAARAGKIIFQCATPEQVAHGANWVLASGQVLVDGVAREGSVVAHNMVHLGETVLGNNQVLETLGKTYQQLSGADSFTSAAQSLQVITHQAPCTAVQLSSDALSLLP